jgi:hypothetical protein
MPPLSEEIGLRTGNSETLFVSHSKIENPPLNNQPETNTVTLPSLEQKSTS